MPTRAHGGVTSVAHPDSKQSISAAIRTVAGLTMVLLTACTADSPLQPSVDQNPSDALVRATPVRDLVVPVVGDSTVTLGWTQVDDGRGGAANYEIRYARPALEWSTAELACAVAGDTVGAPATCVVGGLEPGTTYDFMLMSYRQRGNAQMGAVYSPVATATTTGTPDQTPGPTPTDAHQVEDLGIVQATDTSLTVGWSEVDDGTGEPARYRVVYGAPSIVLATATVGCDVVGAEVGAAASCTVPGLDPATTYDVQLVSYRLAEDGSTWEGATESNITTGDTESVATDPGDGTDPGSEPDPVDPPPSPAPSSSGVWISPAEIALLPTSGSAWNSVLSEANSSCGSVDLADQEQSTNVCIMAKALVFARTGETHYRSDVLDALDQIVGASTYSGRALALGRELVAYVIAADLIDLRNYDSNLDASFRSTLRTLRTTYTSGAASDLVDCHERRPNNWGSHCGASRAAIAVYLGDDAELARTAKVFKGYLGDRAAYSGFSYGSLSWQCDPDRPVGINPAGCTRSGLSLDGVLPDDQRRGGDFTTNPPKENYVWEALQGLLAQAVILHRAGYDVWEWEDRALLRATGWLHDVVDYPAEGDDTWQPHILNRHYGTNLPAPVPSRPGKNVGWTDWTHG